MLTIRTVCDILISVMTNMVAKENFFYMKCRQGAYNMNTIRKTDVIKTRPIIRENILDKLRTMDVATVHETMGRRGALTGSFKPLDVGMRCCGRALTVQCASGDNLMLIKAVSMVSKNDVIVANMGPILNNGPFGEILAVNCVTRGCAGLVISGSVRDSEALVSMKFPVFSEGISVFGTGKVAKGTINYPIAMGEQIVNPGDIILGDRDGVVVIPNEEAETVYYASLQRRKKEEMVIKRIRQGESLFDIYEYQRVFNKLGITEEND